MGRVMLRKNLIVRGCPQIQKMDGRVRSLSFHYPRRLLGTVLVTLTELPWDLIRQYQ
jgi:hypothetical protein